MRGYYQELVHIASDYLGPAAERFVHRQVEFHLEKDPADLTKEDMKKMASSMSKALLLLVKDKKIAEESGSRVRALAGKT